MFSQGKTLKLDKIVEQLLKQYGVEKKMKECEVVAVWNEVVGKMVASKTKKIEMREGRLFVSFTSSVVKNELLLVKEGLIAALNEKVGGEIVRELVIY